MNLFRHYIPIIFSLLCETIFITGCGESLYPFPDPQYTVENDEIASFRLEQIASNPNTGEKRFIIIHISDAHVSSFSTGNNTDWTYPANLHDAVQFANSNREPANALVHTGDMINNSLFTPRQEAITYMQTFIHHLFNDNNVPSFSITGNHDSNMLSTDESKWLSTEDIVSAMFSTGNYPLNRPQGTAYYYADIANPSGGFIRIIGLDMLEQEENYTYNTQKQAFFSQQQIDWLCHVALVQNMTDNHHVILLSHFPFCPTKEDASSYLCDGTFVHSWAMIPEIIEAFRSKTALNKTYPNNYNSSPIFVNADFSTIPGSFVCHLGGHDHAQIQFDIEGIENSSPSLPKQHMILCTNMSPSEKGKIYNKTARIKNSMFNNAFNLMAIDIKERKVYLTYYGAHDTSQPEFSEFGY